MTVRAHKPEFNFREKLKELDYSHLPYEKIQPGGVVQMISKEWPHSGAGNEHETSSSSYQPSKFSITIYPKFADSLIRITSVPNVKENGGSNYHNIAIYRSINDGPWVYAPNPNSTSNGLVTYRFNGLSLYYDSVALDMFDRPNTTGKVEYKIYHRNSGGSYTVRVGENGAYEYMCATEIRQGIKEDGE